MNEIALRLAARLFDRPLIQNQYRSRFIEAMLEPCLQAKDWAHCGDDWAGWDFRHERGCRLEVKQSAAWQTWHAADSQADGRHASGAFDIAERAGWYEGSAWRADRGRPAHIYVFAWNGSRGEAADHRDPHQWEFFVVPTSLLPAQKTIRLSGVLALAGGGGGAVRGPEACAERVEALRLSLPGERA